MTLKLVAALSKMVPMAHLCSASNPNYQVMVIFVVCQDPVSNNILLGMQLSLCVVVNAEELGGILSMDCPFLVYKPVLAASTRKHSLLLSYSRTTKLNVFHRLFDTIFTWFITQ